MFNIGTSYNATALSRLLQSPFPVDITFTFRSIYSWPCRTSWFFESVSTSCQKQC